MGNSPIGPADLASLLAAHGLAGVREEPFEHRGFSGAALTRLRRPDGTSFVLKRMSVARDWIMRATDDTSCREAAFARASIDLPTSIRTPVVGSALDGDEHALLMIDVTSDLIAQGTPVDIDLLLERVAELHALPFPTAPNLAWCDMEQRLLLLAPRTSEIAASYGAPVARDIQRGWELFDGYASPRARRIIRGLFDDPSPLLHALEGMPSSLLHGDLKFDNIGFDAERRMWLLDWAMVMRGPRAVELGWFLAINSRSISISLDDVLGIYARHAHLDGDQRARHEALTAVCGLLLRGWRKALDAGERDGAELEWWCERVSAAEPLLDR
ncbi:MAG TPA: phosphotransferase [Dehalococcoidia bacterium]